MVGGGSQDLLVDYHSAVDAFKKDLLERTLVAHGGNRTYAARALGTIHAYCPSFASNGV